ncbi:MAG: ABC transporter ATP-binding protein [Chloroflexi bacterium]|nr:ABC transporter ATP-binding protein [Chloroflexota bacterium]
MLGVSDIRTNYGPIQALKGVSMEVRQGEVVALIGANGAGKTTLLKTVCGILAPKSGQVQFEGARVDGKEPSTLFARGLVLVPEGRGIFTRMSVYENLLLGAYNRNDSSQQIADDIERMLTRFPILRQRRTQSASVLSGGEQQMLAIARALVAKPKLLLMDEPSLGLAPLIVQQIFQIVLELRDEGITILLVEQNAKQALQVADRGYVLETGKMVLSGAAEELLRSTEVQKAYLGGQRNGGNGRRP